MLPPIKLTLMKPDITYIRTWQGWLYIDLYSRNIVGWSMKPTLAIVIDIINVSKPKTKIADQGSQYGIEWHRFCREHNLIQA